MRRFVVLAVGLLVLQAVPVQAGEPDEVTTVRCGGGIGARLELTDLGERVLLRFVLHGSAPGDHWTVWIRRHGPIGNSSLIFHGTVVASDGGRLVVRQFYWGSNPKIYGVRARDPQTDQECEASADLYRGSTAPGVVERAGLS